MNPHLHTNRKTLRRRAVPLLFTLWLSACTTGGIQSVSSSGDNAVVTSGSAKPACCVAKEKKPDKPVVAVQSADGLTIPDYELLDQDGNPVRIYSDLIKGRKVAVIYFFTSCTTICPLLTATMSQVQDLLLEQGRDDIKIISISVDPITDTPTRLKAWSKNFNTKPGWTFVTGDKHTVDNLLKSLKSFTPDPQDHSPMILIGDDAKNHWKLVSGLSPAADLSRAIQDVVGPKAPKKAVSADDVAKKVIDSRPVADHTPKTRKENSQAKNYFTDVELLDQNGKPHRLYTDLMRGRVLVIDSFFSSCTGVCPVMNRQLTEVYKAFEDRMGKDLFLLSISVDPTVDTPERLKEYAQGLNVGPGWYFLTGSKENVETALRKFGMYVENREDHSNLFMIGNDAQGLWKKAFGLAPAEELVAIVDSVLNDRGEASN